MLQEVVDVMVKAATIAGQEALSIRTTGELQTELKHTSEEGYDKDIVTNADRASEATIYSTLHKAFPTYAISAEEGTEVSGADYLFLVDPLDGTFRFARGMEGFGISIGLLYNGKPIAGVIHYPALDVTLRASIGKGAEIKTKSDYVPLRLQTNKQTQLPNLLVGCDFTNGLDADEQVLGFFRALKRAVRYPLTYACTTEAFRCLCLGQIDGYIHPGTTKFDLAAIACIIPEAGGAICDISGGPLDLTKRWVPVIITPDKHTQDLLVPVFQKK